MAHVPAAAAASARWARRTPIRARAPGAVAIARGLEPAGATAAGALTELGAVVQAERARPTRRVPAKMRTRVAWSAAPTAARGRDARRGRLEAAFEFVRGRADRRATTSNAARPAAVPVDGSSACRTARGPTRVKHIAASCRLPKRLFERVSRTPTLRERQPDKCP